nr:glycosyltransferase [Bacteroidota bacterium]
MPAFNAEKYIGESILSLLAQSFSDFELIVVNDASTDKTHEIVKGIRDDRIILVNNDTNRGIVYSRNRGLKMARGSFIAPFDSDDIALADKFEKQITFLNSHPEYGMIGCWARLVDGSGDFLRKYWKLNAKPSAIRAIMLFRNYFVHSALLIRREAFPESGYMEGYDVVEDYRLCVDIANKFKVWNLPEFLINYRVHPHSAMRSDEIRMRNQDEKIIKYLFNELEIDLTVERLNAMIMLKDFNSCGDKDFLHHIRDLFYIILEQNAKLGVYDSWELKKVVANRWLKSCNMAGKHNMGAFFQLVRLPLFLK